MAQIWVSPLYIPDETVEIQDMTERENNIDRDASEGFGKLYTIGAWTTGTWWLVFKWDKKVVVSLKPTNHLGLIKN